MKDRTTLVLAALLLLLVTRPARAENGAADLTYCTNISKLVKLAAQARDRGDKLSDEELFGMIYGLFGSIAATSRSAGGALYTLYSHTDQLAELIREDRIDILVDLTQHMAHNRLLMFARKPAPVQVAWLAYPGTTGLAALDYRISDPYLDPPALFDACYSEESIRLPDTFWCYDPLTTEAKVNALPALKNGFITFGCLNHFCKINSQTVELYGDVLRAVDGSRLLLLAPEGSARRRILDQWRQQGIPRERIEFVGKTSRPEYLKLYQRMDIALDTLPYNGITTTCDALWMGVPVVSLAGKTAAGRAGLGLLAAVELSELATKSPDDFLQTAKELASNLPRLTELRQTLRPRMEASALMDAPRFARNIEAAYRAMWRRWCAATP